MITFIENTEECKLGIIVDHMLNIFFDDSMIGLLFVSDVSEGSLFLEWAELEEPFRKKGHYRKVLISLMEHYNIEKIKFDTLPEYLAMYLHLGSVIEYYDEIREMYEMVLEKKNIIK